jgi:hypothetical protein
MDEMKHQVTGGLSQGGMRVAHVAHLGGALAGVLLVLALLRLPAGDDSDNSGGGKGLQAPSPPKGWDWSRLPKLPKF